MLGKLKIPPKLSSVHVGTRFEHHAMSVLFENLSMALEHVGGREDGGVELNSIMIRVTLPGMLKIRGHSLSMKNKGLSINARDVKVCENFICEDKTFLYA